MTQPLVECVPNFSEGRDRGVIDAIARAIAGVSGVTLLDVDPGADTNRTVYTFVGEPAAASEAAYRAAAAGLEGIDMTRHQGAHPRIGAMDVCPFVPVAGVTMAECAELARALGQRIGAELGVPVYFYEHAASNDRRRSLASIRAGEYEGLAAKLADPDWQPDAGPAVFNARAGAFVVGAREFLIAYNVNLNTKDRRLAHDIALSIREAGRLARDPAGQALTDPMGHPVRQAGRLRAVRAIGWYIDEYAQAQVSVNLLDFRTTPLHVVFETIREEADARGLVVTGSELVGLSPLEPLLEAGRHFRRKQRKSPGIPERDLVDLAALSLGLHQLSPFDPAKKVIEYRVRSHGPLASLPLDRFVDAISTESPVPGGGSVAALLGALGAALAAMVANLPIGSRAGHEQGADAAAALADRAQRTKDALVAAIDADAAAFGGVLEAMRLPRAAPGQEAERAAALDRAYREAAEVPLGTARLCVDAAALADEAAAIGLAASATDAGVAALAARAGVEAAALNVLVNLGCIRDTDVQRAGEQAAAAAVLRVRELADRTLARVHRALPARTGWLPEAPA